MSWGSLVSLNVNYIGQLYILEEYMNSLNQKCFTDICKVYTVQVGVFRHNQFRLCLLFYKCSCGQWGVSQYVDWGECSIIDLVKISGCVSDCFRSVISGLFIQFNGFRIIKVLSIGIQVVYVPWILGCNSGDFKVSISHFFSHSQDIEWVPRSGNQLADYHFRIEDFDDGYIISFIFSGVMIWDSRDWLVYII